MRILKVKYLRITNSNQNNPGDILISCGQTLSSSQASIKFTCDHNANGLADEGESEIFKTYTLNDDGTCSRRNKPFMNCRENDVIITTSTTTTTTMPPTTTHTELCMGCLQLGAKVSTNTQLFGLKVNGLKVKDRSLSAFVTVHFKPD